MPVWDAESVLVTVADSIVAYSREYQKVVRERAEARSRVVALEVDLRAANQRLADAGSERDHATESRLAGQRSVLDRAEEQVAGEKAALRAEIASLSGKVAELSVALGMRASDLAASRVREDAQRQQLHAAHEENGQLRMLLRAWSNSYQALEARAANASFVGSLHTQLLALKRCHDNSKGIT